MGLRFTRRRVLWNGDDGEQWPRDLAVDDADVPQLVAILRLFGADVREADLRSKSAKDVFVGGSVGLKEVPIEAWDVEDDTGRVRYQLWTYYADGGALFDAGTTKQRGVISQCEFHDHDIGDDAEDLETARDAVEDDDLDCDLAGVSFA